MAGRVKRKRDFSKYRKPISFRPDAETLRKFKKIYELMVGENNLMNKSMVLVRAIDLLYENMIRPETRKMLLERELTEMAKRHAMKQKELQASINRLDEELKKKEFEKIKNRMGVKK